MTRKWYLLWYDDSKRSLAAKIADACASYRAKFDAEPTVCYVNPAQLEPVELAVRVEGRENIIKNHFEIG